MDGESPGEEVPPPPTAGVSRAFVELCMETPLVYRFGAPIVFSLTWPTPMQIYWNKGERLHKKRVQLWDTYIGRRDVMWKQSGNTLSFHSRTSIRAHKKKILRGRGEIRNFSNTWNGLYTAGNQEERLFQGNSNPFWCDALWKRGSSNCCTVFELWWRHCENDIGDSPKDFRKVCDSFSSIG